MTIVWMLLRWLWPFAVGALVWWWADSGWCNSACQSARDDADVQKQAASKFREQLAELDRQRIQQQERWVQLTAAEELRQRDQDAERKRRFAAVRNSAPSTDSHVPLSDGTKRMLADAYAAAQAAEATREPIQTAPADSGAATIANWQKWSVDILEWAAECRDRVNGWERWYGSLQETPHE